MEPRQLLRRSLLFRNLGDDALATLERQVSLVRVDEDDVIVQEGEPGDEFFVIADGAVRVTTTGPDGAQIPLARLVPGDHFGEQALLEERPAPRTATVRAAEASRLYRIPGPVFREILKFDGRLLQLLKARGREYLVERLRKQSAAVQSVAVTLSDFGSHLESFEDRQVIFYQDDAPDRVYALVSGAVRIKFLDDDRQAASVVRVTPGQIFGERSAIRATARHGTAVADGDVQVIAIPAQEIWQLHQSSPEFRDLCASLQNIYDVPALGQVMQYQGTFMDMPAHCLLIRRAEGADFVSYKLVDSDVFGIARAHVDATEVCRYEADNEDAREISLHGDELVGITSFGHWSDSADMAALVMLQPVITQDDRRSFREAGTLPAALRRLDALDPGVLCRCMRVRTADVDALIESGVNEIGEIMSRTGAATVCGTCAPRISERLGHDVWAACTLQAHVRHTEDVWSFRIAPRKAPIAPFMPGQHIVVRADIGGNRVERAYSLTSTARDPYYEITVKREPRGLFSGWLFERGDRETTVYASAPQGAFSLDVAAARPIVFFCGGIGITPAIALLRHAMLDPPASPEIVLDCSAGRPQDVVFPDVINAATGTLARFRCFRRATSVEGRISDAHVAGLLESCTNPLVYLCGPKPFEDSLVRTLLALGVADGDIHVEEFTPVIGRAA